MSTQACHPKIDPELKALIPPLTAEERGLLEESLLLDGCRDPLVVWKQEGVLLDGHNRLDICKKCGIGYTVKYMEFASRAEAVAWMVRNQLGRRNITEEQKSYLRGRRYQEEKKEAGNPNLQETSEKTNVANGATLGRTGKQLAEEYGVGERTIHNDAAFAATVDTVVAKAVEAGEDASEARAALLSGKATKAEVEEMAEKSAAELKQELVEIRQRKKKKIRRRTAAGKRRVQARLGSNGKAESSDGDGESEPAEEPDILTDQEGHEIPEKARPAFQQAAELNAACRQLDDLIREVERLGKSPVGAHLHYQSVQTHLKNAKNGLWTARPTHVCPYCKCKKKTCDACRGHGWVTASTYKATPEELRKS